MVASEAAMVKPARSISQLVECGVFGDVKYVCEEPDNRTEMGAQFVSSIAFINLFVEGPSGNSVLPLVMKNLDEQSWTRDNCRQFRTELLMYQEVLPALGADQEWYPKLYYGQASGRKGEDVLVLENLRYKDFFNSKPLFLNFEHISVAMKMIAKFHSLSFILKHENVERFFELSNKFERCENYVGSIVSMERGVRLFQKSNGDETVLDDFLDAINSVPLATKASSPEEPFGVICHGDFCNNNTIFKYDEKGCPIECAIFDFQLACYGSPATDLALYLYMHTTSESRETSWDDFLKIYWDTLRENVPHHIQLPSFEDFLEHFASRAVYGYSICSFLIPIMLSYHCTSSEVDDEEVEDKIRDIVSHLYHRKYIHAFLDFAKN